MCTHGQPVYVYTRLTHTQAHTRAHTAPETCEGVRVWGSQTGVSWWGPPWFGGPGWSALTQKMVLNGARGLKTKEGSFYRGLVLPLERCPLLQQAMPPTAPKGALARLRGLLKDPSQKLQL